MSTLFLAYLLLQSSPGALPSVPVPVPLPPVAACTVVAPRSGTGEAGAAVDLYATCGEQGVWLGKSSSYRSAYNIVSRSLLVETVGPLGKRVQLVSLDADGVPHIDEVTRELAALSGHYIGSGLVGIDLDLTTFALTGTVLVPVTVLPTGPMPAPGRVPSGAGAGSSAASFASPGAASEAPVAIAKLDLLPYAARVAAITLGASPTLPTSSAPQGGAAGDSEVPAVGR